MGKNPKSGAQRWLAVCRNGTHSDARLIVYYCIVPSIFHIKLVYIDTESFYRIGGGKRSCYA